MKTENTQFNHNSLPQGWYWVRLSDLCIPDRKIVEPGSELAMRLPYLSLEHIESNTGRILRSPSDVRENEGQSTTFAFDSRHILYGKLRPYLNKVALPNFEGRATTELIPFLPIPNVSRRYLAWLFRHPNTVAIAMREKTGSRMPRANIDTILSLQFPVPDSFDEQEKLANLMESQMTYLEQAKKACLEQLALMEELSAQFITDFPLKIS